MQESVFLGFNDFQEGVWGKDYETEREYWQISYEWGRQIAQHLEGKGRQVSWKAMNKIPRALSDAVWGAMSDGTFLH